MRWISWQSKEKPDNKPMWNRGKVYTEVITFWVMTREEPVTYFVKFTSTSPYLSLKKKELHLLLAINKHAGCREKSIVQYHRGLFVIRNIFHNSMNLFKRLIRYLAYPRCHNFQLIVTFYKLWIDTSSCKLTIGKLCHIFLFWEECICQCKNKKKEKVKKKI